MHFVCQYALIMSESVISFSLSGLLMWLLLQDEGDWNLTRRQSDLFWAAAWDVWLHHISTWSVQYSLNVNAPSVVTSSYKRLVQMKPVQELFLATLLKILTMWFEAGFPLMPQPVVSHDRELSGLILEPLQHHGLDIFLLSKSVDC